MLTMAAMTFACFMGTAEPAPYTQETVEGWTVMVGAPLSQAPRRLKERTLQKLRQQLKQVVAVLNSQTLEELRRVVIWVERKSPGFKGLVYLRSAAWLKQHGYNPQKARGVQVSHALNYVIRKTAPWAIMHELAHAYHHQVVGNDHKGIAAAYVRARDSGKYERVERAGSKKRQRHYGMQNADEFFAEMTETYLGENDFAPFNRAALKRFDPQTYRVLHSIWGPRLRASKVPSKTSIRRPQR